MKYIIFEKLLDQNDKPIPSDHPLVRTKYSIPEEPVVDNVYADKDIFFSLLTIGRQENKNNIDTYYCTGKIVKIFSAIK
jgi:hypothetical protein